MNFKTLRLLAKKKRRTLLRSGIPNSFTFANACFGFIATIYVLDDNVYLAAWALVFCIVADMLDGICARTLHASSEIGAELDSLADAISFCLAPAIMVYKLAESPPVFFHFFLLIYICSGLFRLARFSLSKKSFSYFQGLPSPAAAFVLINLALYKDWFTLHGMDTILSVPSLSCILLLLALLMISHIPFPAWKTARMIKPYQQVLFCSGVFSIMAIALLFRLPIFLLAAISYIAAACLLYFILLARRCLTSVS